MHTRANLVTLGRPRTAQHTQTRTPTAHGRCHIRSRLIQPPASGAAPLVPAKAFPASKPTPEQANSKRPVTACVTPFWVSLGNKLIPPPIDIHLTDAGTNTMALHEGLITGRGRGGLRENERTPDRERARESGCVCVRERERERERKRETDRERTK